MIRLSAILCFLINWKFWNCLRVIGTVLHQLSVCTMQYTGWFIIILVVLLYKLPWQELSLIFTWKGFLSEVLPEANQTSLYFFDNFIRTPNHVIRLQPTLFAKWTTLHSLAWSVIFNLSFHQSCVFNLLMVIKTRVTIGMKKYSKYYALQSVKLTYNHKDNIISLW